jgi:hypothetical protein
MQIMAEICQNRTTGKDRFFRRSYVAQTEKCKKLMKVWQQPGACAQEIVDQKDVLRIFTNFYGTAQKSVSRQQLPQILPPPIRGSSWHKNEIKMIRRGHYSSNDFQDSTKRKSTENKTWVISQECFSLTPLS